MELNTDFLAAPAPAQADEAPVETTVETPSTEETAPATLEAPVEEPAVEAPAEATTEESAAEEAELTEEELQKLMADERAPKWYRDKLKQVQGYTSKLRSERDTVQSQFEQFKTQYEASQLPETDLERLRLAEERQYKLSSFNTPAEEILSSLQEIVPQQKIQEVKSHLAWEFLETPDGKPDLDNLQVIIDRFTGYKEGDTKVSAKDVMSAIDALKRGTIKSEELLEFESDAEYQAFQKARTLEEQALQREQMARANAEFQEKQTRSSLIQNVNREIQSQFQPRVETLLNKFQLMPSEGDPKIAQDMKAAIQNKIRTVINEMSVKSPYLGDVWKGMEMLQTPTGATPDKIQAEVNAFVSSFPYQTALNKGLNELMSAVEKTIAQEAHIYSLAMEGYKARVAKGQGAREIIDAPNQTEVLTQYTPEQLAAMSATERRHRMLEQVSNQIRDMQAKTSRYGG